MKQNELLEEIFAKDISNYPKSQSSTIRKQATLLKNAQNT